MRHPAREPEIPFEQVTDPPRWRSVTIPHQTTVFWMLLALQTIVALSVATTYIAAHWQYDLRLGHAALVPSARVATIGQAAALLLGAAGAGIGWQHRRWSLGVLGLLTAGALWAGTRFPWYLPTGIVTWTVRYHRSLAAMTTLRTGWSIGAMTLLSLVLLTVLLRRPSSRRHASASHGTARWGTGQRFRAAQGVMLGRWHGEPLRYGGDGHLITVAPTRAGKGVHVVIPNLLTYPGSCIVTDPKGENAAITARRRRELGATVHIFDPFEVMAPRHTHAPTDTSEAQTVGASDITPAFTPDAIPETAAFNPMDLIDGVVHGDGIDAHDDARMLADMLVVVDGKDTGEQAFWHEEARALLSGLILHVATAAPPEARHLARVRELLTLPPDEFDVLLQEMSASDAAHGLVRRAAARVLQKADKERSGVVSSAQAHTHFLDSPRMATVLNTSTVDLTGLLSGCVTCYLILPPERLETYHRWLRLMIACGILTMTRHAGRRRRPRPVHRVLFLLDEFAHLGRMAPIERDLALVGGYGASFWLVLQDLGQLKATYPEKWSSMLANAEVLQAFAVNDWDTADYLSKLTGEATVLVESDNVSRSRSHGKSSGSQESAAQTVSEKARRLLLPDEIRRLGPKQLLFGRGVAPVIADLHDYRYEFAQHADPHPFVG